MATAPMKKRLPPKNCWPPGGYFELLISSSCSRKRVGEKVIFPWEVVSYWAQKRQKKLWTLVFCTTFSELSKYGSCLHNLVTLFPSCLFILAKCLRAFPWEVLIVSYWAQKRAKKKLWIIVFFTTFSELSKYGSCLQNLLLYFQVVCIFWRNAYAWYAQSLLDNWFLGDAVALR